MLRRGCRIMMMGTLNGARRLDDEGKYSEFITPVNPEINGLPKSEFTIVVRRGRVAAREDTLAAPEQSGN